jgi:hypothetical protein
MFTSVPQSRIDSSTNRSAGNSVSMAVSYNFVKNDIWNLHLRSDLIVVNQIIFSVEESANGMAREHGTIESNLSPRRCDRHTT